MDISILLAALGGSSSFLLLLYGGYQLAVHPEKVEIWASLINKCLSKARGVFRGAHKRYVKHDLQGRINRFVKQTSKAAPYLADMKLAVEWAGTDMDKETLLANNRVILRLRREDPEDLNFVHGVYWSVSTRLIPKATRYISPSQREALDLFVTSQMIEQEKYSVKDYFLAHYLHPRMENGNDTIPLLYSKFDTIDKHGVFYPVLLQELYFLSQKVYGGPKNDRIIIEVTKLVDFLEKVAKRNVGEEMDLEFTGKFCRFAIVIIGKSYNISDEGARVYINYVNEHILPQEVETIYLLGKYEYCHFIDQVCDHLPETCERYADYHYQGRVMRTDGFFIADEYLVVLRTSHAALYQQ